MFREPHSATVEKIFREPLYLRLPKMADAFHTAVFEPTQRFLQAYGLSSTLTPDHFWLVTATSNQFTEVLADIQTEKGRVVTRDDNFKEPGRKIAVAILGNPLVFSDGQTVAACEIGMPYRNHFETTSIAHFAYTVSSPEVIAGLIKELGIPPDGESNFGVSRSGVICQKARLDVFKGQQVGIKIQIKDPTKSTQFLQIELRGASIRETF